MAGWHLTVKLFYNFTTVVLTGKSTASHVLGPILASHVFINTHVVALKAHKDGPLQEKACGKCAMQAPDQG